MIRASGGYDVAHTGFFAMQACFSGEVHGLQIRLLYCDFCGIAGRTAGESAGRR
jgi:hypothetical protein